MGRRLRPRRASDYAFVPAIPPALRRAIRAVEVLISDMASGDQFTLPEVMARLDSVAPVDVLEAMHVVIQTGCVADVGQTGDGDPVYQVVRPKGTRPGLP